MNTKEVQRNKQGQTLGRKGLETRASLMDAARRLLESQSPLEITAVAIAAEAGTSPASFYMYFDDTKDILYALSEIAGRDMAEIHSIFDEPWTVENLEEQAGKVVRALMGVWDKHREVLRYRNLEADRGDIRFEDLRMNTYVPFIERFAQRILAFSPPGGTRKRADVYAEASIFQAAMERLAATDPGLMERGLGMKRITNNLARMIALVLRSSMAEAASAQTQAPAPAPASAGASSKARSSRVASTPGGARRAAATSDMAKKKKSAVSA